MKRAQSVGAGSTQGGAPTQEGEHSPSSSGSGVKRALPLDLSSVTNGQLGETAVFEAGSESSGSSPEVQDGHATRKSSGGEHSQEVGHSPRTLENIKALIITACENAQSDEYSTHLVDVYRELDIESPDEKSHLVTQIAKEQKSIPGCDSLLHVATEFGAWEIVVLLLKNGFQYFVDKTNDELKKKDPEFLPQTPLTFAVRRSIKKIVFELLPLSKHSEDSLCSAIHYYEETRSGIEPLLQLMDRQEFKSCLRQIGLKEFSPLDLYALRDNAVDFDGILEQTGDNAAQLQVLLDNLSKEELQNWHSNENISIDSLQNIEPLKQFHNQIYADTFSLEDLISYYYEHSNFARLSDGLLSEFRDNLFTVLDKASFAIRREILLKELLEKFKNTQTIQKAGWPHNLRPLQMLSVYRDKKYFKQVLQYLPTKARGVLPEQRITDQHGNNLLHLAIKEADLTDPRELEFVKYLLQAFEELWNWVNFDDQSPLSVACLERNVALIKLMAGQKKERVLDVTKTYHKGQPVPREVAAVLPKEIKESPDLSVVQEKRTVEDKFQLQLNGHRFPPVDKQMDKKLDSQKKYITPLEEAAKLGNDDVVELLLTLWPLEASKLLEKITNENPYLIALQLERSALLNAIPDEVKKNPYFPRAGKRWGQVQFNIIRFIHASDKDGKKENTRELFVRELVKATQNEINQVSDAEVKRSHLLMLDQLQSDYLQLRTDVLAKIVPEYTDEDITQINKIFSLVNELRILASVAKIKGVSSDQLQKAKETFEHCCNDKLTSDGVTARNAAMLCALIGLIIGALAGFLAGTLVTGGGPGGFWLALPSAQYGAAVGASVGCVVGAAVGGIGCYKLSDLFKWQRGLWSVSGAVNSIKTNTNTQNLDESTIPLLEVK